MFQPFFLITRKNCLENNKNAMRALGIRQVKRTANNLPDGNSDISN